MDKLKSVAKCYAYIETSSNPADIDKMTNGDTASYWQSDGSARSHWIRWVAPHQLLGDPRAHLISALKITFHAIRSKYGGSCKMMPPGSSVRKHG